MTVDPATADPATAHLFVPVTQEWIDDTAAMRETLRSIRAAVCCRGNHTDPAPSFEHSAECPCGRGWVRLFD